MIYPLLFGSLTFLSGCFLTIKSEYISAKFFIILLMLALVFSLIYYLYKRNHEISLTIAFCLVVLILSNMFSTNFINKRYDYLENLYGNKINVIGKVTQISENYYIKAEKINGDKVPFNLKLLISGYNKIDCIEGDFINISGKINPFKKAAYYGDFNTEAYYFSINVYGQLSVDDYEISKGKQSLSIKLRNYIKENIDRRYTGDNRALIKALLIGDKTDMSYEFKEELSKSGLSHIAVVSGMHISIIISVAGMLFGFIKRKRIIFLSLMFMLFDVIVSVIGGHPSVIRAVIMAAYCIIASTLKKRYDPLTALMFSGLLIAIFNPYCVGGISFILSFAATGAIIIGSKKQGKNLLYVTISVFLITLPLCLFFFNRATLAMFFTNLLISPVMTLMLPIGYLAQVLPVLDFVQNILLYILILVIKTFSSIKIFNITTAVPSILMISALYFLIASFYCITLYKRKYMAVILISLSVILILVNSFMHVISNNSVIFFENNENALHIKTKNNKNVFITSEPDAIRNYITDNNIGNIDFLVLTKMPDDINMDNVSKVFVPYMIDQKIKGDFSVKYYDDISFGIDNVLITPVSYLPNKSKADEKRAVLLIKTDKKSILFEPYKETANNEKYLNGIEADFVVLRKHSEIYDNAKTIVGSGLQSADNMIYYDLSISGSLTVKNNKITTLR